MPNPMHRTTLSEDIARDRHCDTCDSRLIGAYLWPTLSLSVRGDLLAEGFRMASRSNRCRACCRRPAKSETFVKTVSAAKMVSMWEEWANPRNTANANYRLIAEILGVPWTRVAKAIQREKKAGYL